MGLLEGVLVSVGDGRSKSVRVIDWRSEMEGDGVETAVAERCSDRDGDGSSAPVRVIVNGLLSVPVAETVNERCPDAVFVIVGSDKVAE